MQLASRDGIVCDHCGTAYKTDFIYYSFDYKLVSVVSNRKPPLREILNSMVIFSLDICSSCFDSIKRDVVRNYQLLMTSDVRKRGQNNTIICELSGKRFSGQTYDYYMCNVTEVNVRMTGQPNVCTACQHQTYDNDKTCTKCNGTHFSKMAYINVNDRLLEINMCEESFKNMVNKAEIVRKSASEWSTKS